MPYRALFSLPSFASLSRAPSLLAATLAVAASAVLAQPAPHGSSPENAQAREAVLKHRQAQRAAEKADIAQQRRAMAERQKPLEAACYQKFAVENCLKDLRDQARAQEKPLRERELQINADERREKSEERLRGIEQKMNEPRTLPVMQGAQRKPLTGQGQPPERTQADVERDRAAINAQAQQRSQDQAKRVQSKQSQQAERVQSEAERRAAAQEAAQQRQEEAAKAKARRDKAVGERRGAPLPVPAAP